MTNNMANQVDIFTDGAARGNPDGPGGFGAILRFIDAKGESHEKELSAGFVKTTNNRMELMGIIKAIEQLEKPCKINVYSDSKYVISAFNQHWIDNWKKNGWKTSTIAPVKNRELWERLLKAMSIHSISYHWVKGHNGNPENERCDELATKAADGAVETLLIDDGTDLCGIC